MRFTSSTHAKTLRSWALLAVAGNLATVALAALVLPASAHVLLPILAIALPLLTSAVLETAERRPASEAGQPGRDRRPRHGATARPALT